MSRIDRLKDELKEYKLIEELTLDHNLTDIVLDEIDYAIHAPLHERKSPSYGVVVVPKPIAEDVSIIDVSKIPIDLARCLSDGAYSFAVRTPSGVEQVACLSIPFISELLLIGLQERFQGTFIHREPGGRVRIYTGRSVLQRDSGHWSTKPYSKNVLGKILHCVPQADPDLLHALLLLSFHCLSPSNVGATLVWPIVDTSSPPLALAKVGVRFAEQVIDCGDASQYGAIRSLLSQHDGAAILSLDGKITSLGDHLGYSSKASELIPSNRGTRHTSAQRFSFDEPRVVIIVISEDGPVSVFSDGLKLTELNMKPVGTTERVYKETTPEKAHHMETDYYEVDCPKCSRHYLVEVFTIYGWKEKETGECLVCGETIYSRNCFKITVHLRKQL